MWLQHQTARCTCTAENQRGKIVPYAGEIRMDDLSQRNFYKLPLPLALQPAVGFGLSKNTSPFFPIYHQLSPSSHSQHLKIFFCFFSPSLPVSSSSSHPFQFLSEDLFGHPILLHSLQVTQPAYPLPLYPFYYISSFTQLF